MRQSKTPRTDPEPNSTSNVTIGVFGHYGNENLGDEAIVEASIRNIRKRLPDARIICFSLRPNDTEARYGLQAYPVRNTVNGGMSRLAEMEMERKHRTPGSLGERVAEPERTKTLAGRLKAALKTVPIFFSLARLVATIPQAIWRLGREIGFLWRSRTVLKGVNLLFIAGSNQFLDNFGGTWGYPYTLLKWTLLAKSTGTKVAFVSVGAGPLSAGMSKLMIRTALALANYQSVRDKQSKALLRGGEQTDFPLVYPDLAFSLPINHDELTRVRAKPTVGINLMPVYNEKYWFLPDQEKYRRYVSRMAEFAAFLVQEGYPTFFFSSQPYDELAIDDVTDALSNMGLDRNQVPARAKPSNTVAELMEVVRRADVVVATRFHGTVLALHAHRAVLGVCYQLKAIQLLEDMDQKEYAFHLDDFRIEDLKHGFQRLAANLEAKVERIGQRHAEYQHALDEQYGNVLRLLA